VFENPVDLYLYAPQCTKDFKKTIDINGVRNRDSCREHFRK
jgi:hypothetical protein